MSAESRSDVHSGPPADDTAPGEREFSYSGTELTALATAHNYYRWIVSAFRPWLRGRVVEVGAGIGTFARRLAAEPGVEELLLVEPATELSAALRQRFAAEPRVGVRQGYLGEVDLGDSVDAIVLVNVLEHIERDGELARTALATLRPGGALLLFVPALPFLYGTLDEAFDHHRRYTRPGLEALLRDAGFGIERLHHVNFPGIFPWWISGRLLRKRTIGAREMRLYDRLVLPWVLWIEDRVRPPVGQSLLAVATKENSRE